MSDSRRRRGFPGGMRRAPARPRRVGEPNVLSDAATPNVLSTQAGGRGTLTAGRPSQPGPSRPSVATAPQAGQGWLATGQAVAPARVRLPSFGTLIFLGFIAITVFRLVGEFASGITLPTSEPVATSPAKPVTSTAPGPITFGTGQGTDCQVNGASAEFAPTANVWWSAELATPQAADAAVVVIVRRDGAEVDREFVPPDPSSGKWTVLCAGEPIRVRDPGVYRVEVWNEDETVIHALGEYRVRSS